MKTLTIKMAGLAAIALLVIVTLRVYAQTPVSQNESEPERDFRLKMTKEHEFKNSEAAFDTALNSLASDTVYRFTKKYKDGTTKEKQSKSISLKTDHVTISELAASEPSGELTAIGVHVTQTIYTNTVSDIQKVVDQLK